MSLNYADVVIGILLVLAFARGFVKGLWASVLNLAGTLMSFLGAYFLTQPVVNYLEKNNHLVTNLTDWWSKVFVLVPTYSKPYDPNSVAEFFHGIDSTPWLKPISSLVKDGFLEVEALAGPTALWGKILASLMAQILLSGMVFFVLLALIRFAWSLISKPLTFASALSVPQRVLGGMLQLALSGVWLSFVAGALYPLVALDSLEPIRDTITSSPLLAVLLGVYKVLIPGVFLRINAIR